MTFDNIIGGISSGRYQIGNSSFTDNKAREKQVNFVDYFQAGEGVYAKCSSTAKFTGLKSFCGTEGRRGDRQRRSRPTPPTTAKTCPSSKKSTVLPFPTQTEANLAVSSGQANVRLRRQSDRGLHRVHVQGHVQVRGQRHQRRSLRHRAPPKTTCRHGTRRRRSRRRSRR